jgi:hypothetical protein
MPREEDEFKLSFYNYDEHVGRSSTSLLDA